MRKTIQTAAMFVLLGTSVSIPLQTQSYQAPKYGAKNFSLVGSNKMNNSDSYFFEKEKISRVDRLTGKIKVTNTYPRLRNVAFDGHYNMLLVD